MDLVDDDGATSSLFGGTHSGRQLREAASVDVLRRELEERRRRRGAAAGSREVDDLRRMLEHKLRRSRR